MRASIYPMCLPVTKPDFTLLAIDDRLTLPTFIYNKLTPKTVRFQGIV